MQPGEAAVNRDLAHRVSVALASTTAQPPRRAELSEEEYRAALQAYQERLDTWLDVQNGVIQQYGSLERASSAVGAAIADRGEQLAGITGEQVRDSLAARKADLQDTLNELDRRKEELDEAAFSSRTEQEKQAMEATKQAYEAWVADRGNAELFQAKEDAKAHLQEIQDSPPAHLAQLRDESQRIAREAQSVRDAMRAGIDEQARRELRALSDGYARALAEVRELGGQLQWHPKTAKAARAAFDETAEIFPSDWIGASNADDPPVAKVHKLRAHYSHGNVEATKRRVPRALRRVRCAGQADLAQLQQEWSDSPSIEVVETTDQNGAAAADGELECELREYEVRYREPNSPPAGRGWQPHTFIDRDGTERTVWRRPRYRMETVESERVAEIRTNEMAPWVDGRSSTFAISAHEMCHRFECSTSQITRLEMQFLARRTEDEELSSIYPGQGRKLAREMGYQDDFVDHYMGKVYGRGIDGSVTDAGQNYELLSTGVEALFGGRYGGLIGAHRNAGYHVDHDMRAFVLGVMATADRPDPDGPALPAGEQRETAQTSELA